MSVYLCVSNEIDKMFVNLKLDMKLSKYDHMKRDIYN